MIDGSVGAGSGGTEGSRVIVMNPNSGTADHAETVRGLAAEHGYEVRETEAAGDAIDLADAAAEQGARLVVAAGGDGTLNEVVHGVDRADALDDVTVGVVPVGTGNNFAGNVGITGLEDAFDVLEAGERRRIDLGTANGRLFVNSCVSGVTAEASGRTTPEEKDRLGVLAYVVETLRTVSSFDGLRLTVTVTEGGEREPAWSGSAILVLVGNARRFGAHGSEQSNVEDGRLDVAIVEDVPATEVLEERVVERLLGREAAHIRRFQATALQMTVEEDEPVTFSFDGEMNAYRSLSLAVRPNALRIPVGGDYEPNPDLS